MIWVVRRKAPRRWGAPLVLLLALPCIAAAGEAASPAPPAVPAGITLVEDGARWESAYGDRFYQVVGTVKNGSPGAVGAVRIRTELLDGAGKVVATFEGWNARAEALGDLSEKAARAELAHLAPDPIEPGKSDRFRATFVEDETPKFEKHRVQVVSVLPPAP